jgi:hypothetical protein
MRRRKLNMANKIYTALLTQDLANNAPAAIVFENTLGVGAWQWVDVGWYGAATTTDWADDKTYISGISIDNTGAGNATQIPVYEANGVLVGFVRVKVHPDGNGKLEIYVHIADSFGAPMELYDLQSQAGIIKLTLPELRVY